MSDKTELRPCPFCGLDVHLSEVEGLTSIVCSGGIVCPGSGLIIAYPSGDYETALLAWNTRANQSEDVLAVVDEPVLIPEGYCLMPRKLTAENGAKALLLGEFKVTITRECPECCELDEPTEGCEVCDGEGEFALHQLISWDQIKYIYSKAVGGLAIKPETAQPPQ